ncbi:MAG: aldo/keto reductase [Erysipelotrichaceae bacterium]|nr:aldo/keto reductase [Erysipelotrichaceae bacterium]
MKYAKLGQTDIEVSRLCIGGLSFGEHIKGGHQWLLSQHETTEMIAHAYDMGVNFIDTSNNYAKGTSEQFIGKALKDLAIPRDRIVVATKVFFNEGNLKKEAILREIDGSLERLGLDYVDLYQIHRFDYNTPIEETMAALDSLVKAGKVRALGASAMYGYQLHNMQNIAKEHGWTQFSTMQNHYNLLYREDERELIPVCRQFGMSLIPFSPLAAGHLAHLGWDSGTLRNKTDQIAIEKYDSTKDSDILIVDRVAEIANKYHVSMSEVALAWHYAKGVTAPIVGATKMNHFDQAIKACDLKLSQDDVTYLEELYRPHELVGLIKAQ